MVTPTSTMATASTAKVGAAAHRASARAETPIISGISRRRLRTSPSGTISTIPVAYPTWVAVTSSPAVALLTCNEVAITASRGWT